MKRFMKRHDIVQVNPRMLVSSRVNRRTAGSAQLMYQIYGQLPTNARECLSHFLSLSLPPSSSLSLSLSLSVCLSERRICPFSRSRTVLSTRNFVFFLDDNTLDGSRRIKKHLDREWTCLTPPPLPFVASLPQEQVIYYQPDQRYAQRAVAPSRLK